MDGKPRTIKKPSMDGQTYLPMEISVVVTAKNGKPAVELRKVTTDQELLKQILSAAFHNVPIVVQPTFYNRLQSLNSMVEKGIIYRAEDGQFYYTF